MTQPPHPSPPPPSDSGWSGADEIHDGLPPAPPEPAEGPRRARRALLLTGAATGALVLGGTGYAVASFLSGQTTNQEK